MNTRRRTFCSSIVIQLHRRSHRLRLPRCLPLLQSCLPLKSYYLSEKRNPRDYMLIILGLNTALRISDILRLTYGDVYDYQRKEWKTHIVIIEQKTGKQNRIYMNREVKTVFRNYTDPSSCTPSTWIFTSQKQKKGHLSRYQAYRIVKAAGAFAGLNESISCHSLRKTFGYHAWKQGTAPALLMSIFNHSAYQITKRYLCIEQDDKDEVFAKIKL